MPVKSYPRILNYEFVVQDDGVASYDEQTFEATAVEVQANTVVGQVTANGRWKVLDLAAVDGTAVAKGILCATIPAKAGGTQKCVIARRRLTANGKMLFWPAGISNPNKATAITQLAATDGNGILVR